MYVIVSNGRLDSTHLIHWVWSVHVFSQLCSTFVGIKQAEVLFICCFSYDSGYKPQRKKRRVQQHFSAYFWVWFNSIGVLLVIYLICIQDLDLRVEHTHCFSHHGEGGHYYIDTTPDTVEYLGYFMPAEFVFRIDRPKETHRVGRVWKINE